MFSFRKYVLGNASFMVFVKSVWKWRIWDPASSKSSVHVVLREEGDEQSRCGFQTLVLYNDYIHLPSILITATTSSSVENIANS